MALVMLVLFSCYVAFCSLLLHLFSNFLPYYNISSCECVSISFLMWLGIVNALHLGFIVMAATVQTVAIMLRMRLLGVTLLIQHWSATQMPLGLRSAIVHMQFEIVGYVLSCICLCGHNIICFVMIDILRVVVNGGYFWTFEVSVRTYI